MTTSSETLVLGALSVCSDRLHERIQIETAAVAEPRGQSDGAGRGQLGQKGPRKVGASISNKPIYCILHEWLAYGRFTWRPFISAWAVYRSLQRSGGVHHGELAGAVEGQVAVSAVGQEVQRTRVRAKTHHEQTRGEAGRSPSRGMYTVRSNRHYLHFRGSLDSNHKYCLPLSSDRFCQCIRPLQVSYFNNYLYDPRRPDNVEPRPPPPLNLTQPMAAPPGCHFDRSVYGVPPYEQRGPPPPLPPMGAGPDRFGGPPPPSNFGGGDFRGGGGGGGFRSYNQPRDNYDGRRDFGGGGLRRYRGGGGGGYGGGRQWEG